MIRKPTISIVMPLYNDAKYVRESVDSILSQTLPDFEFIIINDGSEDSSPDIVRSYNDKRIVLVDREHKGLVPSLNHGLAISQGKYIARMDSDDIAYPHRLEKQVAFLEQNEDIGIIGSAYQLVDEYGKDLRVLHPPVSDLHIRWVSLLFTPFPHAAVMMRREILAKNSLSYDEAYSTGLEDYDLWTRMLRHTGGANLQETLIKYRLRSNSATSRNQEAQRRSRDAISLRCIAKYFQDDSLTPEQVRELRGLFTPSPENQECPASHRVKTAGLHLAILDAFLHQHKNETYARQLRTRETLKVLREVTLSPFRPGALRLAGRAISLYAGWPTKCV